MYDFPELCPLKLLELVDIQSQCTNEYKEVEIPESLNQGSNNQDLIQRIEEKFKAFEQQKIKQQNKHRVQRDY